MQTNFDQQQLADPNTARSNDILRSCVHCGFCTATCPTYKVLGDELDSPRGRIYLIKDMLENSKTPDPKTVGHIDRCLSCLSCMTTCPSGVHYMHLIDHARAYIEANYKRPWDERLLRFLLSKILPYPKRFRIALYLAKLARPFRSIVPDKRLRAMLSLAPAKLPPATLEDQPGIYAPESTKIKRVALLTGCAQRTLDPEINASTIRLLQRHGCEVVIPQGLGCCGALTHHMGRTDQSHVLAAANIAAVKSELQNRGLDAVVVNTSGCGTTVKDYGNMFQHTALAEDAAIVATLAKDVSEVLAQLDLSDTGSAPRLRVAYHAACSLQHGQSIKDLPKLLLSKAGFEVVEPRDSHICCGSAGTYNLLQPEISATLGKNKANSISATAPDVVAAGNLGCMIQIQSNIQVPVLHTVQLLDWATGGPMPLSLKSAMSENTAYNNC